MPGDLAHSKDPVWTRIAAVGAVLATIGFFAAAMVTGSALSRPVQHVVGQPPTDLPFQAVTVNSESGSRLAGWFARHAGSSGSVALFHGIRADRRAMLGRARFLYANGYSILLVDLQGHGESLGDRITFGYLESRDAHAAIAFLREQLPGEPIAAIGTSLGGAACLLGPYPLRVDALVLEAVYTDIAQAVENRLRIRFGHLGSWVAPILTVQIKPRLGIDLEQLRPVDRLAEIVAPVLILSGESDRRTTVDETRRMYETAPEPKELWIVPGAAHVDLHRHSPSAYEKRVLGFLRKRLGRTS